MGHPGDVRRPTVFVRCRHDHAASTAIIDQAEADRLAAGFHRYFSGFEADDGLFADDTFFDLLPPLPLWRSVSQGTLTENGESGGCRTWRVYVGVLAALLTVASALAGTEYLGKVIGIADGDTFTLLVGREQLRIRLADTPEKGQPYGRRARQALSALIYGKTVCVVEIDRDRYGRVVGRV